MNFYDILEEMGRVIRGDLQPAVGQSIKLLCIMSTTSRLLQLLRFYTGLDCVNA